MENSNQNIDEELYEKEDLLNYYLLQYDELSKKEGELNLIKQLINDIKPTNDAWINIYNYIFIKGGITDVNKFLVHVGGNVFIEKNKEDIIKIIDKNIEEIKKMKEELKEEINKLSMNINQ